MTSALFQPYKLADLALDNRIVISPMCQYSANDGCASDWHLTHLGMLAGSGAALVVIEATHVERHGRISHGCMGLYSDANEAALARAIAHARSCGAAKFGVQLAHAGRKGSAQRPWEGGAGLTATEDPWETISPSALPFGQSKWHTPRVATENDLARVRDAFAAAAARAVRIGFDAIELHAAHGYLIHSFMSPIANTRTDQYGGSLENRMRFPLEVARAVRAVVPKGLPLGARVTGSDWLEGGLTVDDAVACARMLKQAGLDYLDVSSGGITAETRNPSTPGYNVDIAARIRSEVAIATRTVGLIVTPQQAETVVAEGKADMVALGRAALDHPHWAWAAAYALGAEANIPKQYQRAGKTLWPGVAMRS